MPSEPSRQGSKPPARPGSGPSPKPGRRPPATRQERREAQRRGADPRLAAAKTSRPSRPAWQSPMVLISGAAVAIGLVLVVLASGLLNPRTATGLKAPVASAPKDLVEPTNPRALGKAGAPVTIDVWSDFQCPACSIFARNVEVEFIEKYVQTGKARLVYRDFAFIDGGRREGESHASAVASRCAADQGSFWPYHDYLMENQNGENRGWFSADLLARIADAVGLDRAAFDACVGSGAAAKLDLIVAETAEGRDSVKVTGTPTVTVNGARLPIAANAIPTFADLAKEVDALTGGASPSP